VYGARDKGSRYGYTACLPDLVPVHNTKLIVLNPPAHRKALVAKEEAEAHWQKSYCSFGEEGEVVQESATNCK
jgi:hypothetical protein